MNVDPQWSRPAQRDRHGVRALHLRSRPSAVEMAFDKLVVTIPGTLSPVVSGQPAPDVLEGYRAVMQERARRSAGAWRAPGITPSFVATRLSHDLGTIAGAMLTARLSIEVHDISLTLTVNPTRTLIHALTMVDEEGYTGAHLDALPPDIFFGWSARASAARTLDLTDNAFARLDRVMDRMGDDHAAAFIGIFERQLKRWAIEAIAPARLGFEHNVLHPMLIAESAGHRVALDWHRLFLRSAEVYCERRHGDAIALLNRLSSTVLAAHADADWRSYDIDQFGGRAEGSTVVGVKPTGHIDQVFYAKAADRVRIETRYHGRVRDNLRGELISADLPLRELLLGLRRDVASRLRWDSFCAMTEEPPTPMLTDFARLAAVIAQCAAQAKVDPEPVFAELFGGGGLDVSPNDGRFPRRLVRRLESEGLIHGENLQRRARPGQARRYHLRQPYLSIANALQRAFGPSPARS